VASFSVITLFGKRRVAGWDGAGGVSMASLFGDHHVATVGSGEVRGPTLFGEQTFYSYNGGCRDRDAAPPAPRRRLRMDRHRYRAGPE